MSEKILKNNCIAIVPNSEVAEYESELKIVSSDKSFYQQFKEHNMEVVICAVVNHKNKNFGWNINSEANISCIKQNLII